MISSTIDMTAIKLSSSSSPSSSSSSSPIITTTPTSASITTLLHSLVLFLDDLSSRSSSYLDHMNQMITSNITQTQTLEHQLNTYQDEIMDIGSSLDSFNHQLRVSGIIDDTSRNNNNSNNSSSSNSGNIASPIRSKVSRFDEGNINITAYTD